MSANVFINATMALHGVGYHYIYKNFLLIILAKSSFQ